MRNASSEETKPSQQRTKGELRKTKANEYTGNTEAGAKQTSIVRDSGMEEILETNRDQQQTDREVSTHEYLAGCSETEDFAETKQCLRNMAKNGNSGMKQIVQFVRAWRENQAVQEALSSNGPPAQK